MVDALPDGTGNSSDELYVEDKNQSLELVKSSESSDMAKKIATAAIFAAASLAASPIAAFIPRIPGWNIALFDPISFFWIAAFLVGGLWVGLISALAGMMGLFFFDPSGIGPVFKFEATFFMMVVPWLIVRLFGRRQGGAFLRLPKHYGPSMALAAIIRIPVMIVTNLIAVPILYGPIFTAEYIITYTLLVNGLQSVLDALVPYLVIHVTPVFRRFGMW